jgi:hypothetical protein
LSMMSVFKETKEGVRNPTFWKSRVSVSTA